MDGRTFVRITRVLVDGTGLEILEGIVAVKDEIYVH
jgi:hypothetical protein